jgi:hypothetical protein
MFLRLRAGGGAPWRLQGDGGHHGWGVFVVLSCQKSQCTDSYMKKGGQIKMSILTFISGPSRGGKHCWEDYTQWILGQIGEQY